MRFITHWFRLSRKPDSKAWSSHRRAIVLPPIDHVYEPVSKVDHIKQYSCFLPWGEHRTAMKKLPCGQPCCMSMTPAKMKACPNREVTGSFDKSGMGQGIIQFRIKAKKKTKITFQLNNIDRRKHEKTFTIDELTKLAKKTPEKKSDIRPKRRKPSDFQNPKMSAQTRKGRLPHNEDTIRYKNDISNFKMSPGFLRSRGSFLVSGSPLQPSINELKNLGKF